MSRTRRHFLQVFQESGADLRRTQRSDKAGPGLWSPRSLVVGGSQRGDCGCSDGGAYGDVVDEEDGTALWWKRWSGS